MHLTTHTDYALRVLLFAGAAGETVTITRVSGAFGISKEHLRKVVHSLSQLGYLHTTQGRHGGIALARPAEEINIAEVVRQFEPGRVVECFDAETASCAIDGMCGLKHALHRAHASFMDTLGEYSLADFIRNPHLVAFCRNPHGEAGAEVVPFIRHRGAAE